MGDSEDIEFHAPLGKPIPITAGGNANDDQTKNPDVTAAKSKARAGDFGPKLRVTLCILFAELCERLTYYGVTGNLLLFCTQELNMSSADGSTIVLVFGGVCYIVPIIGGWVADSISGKYNAIYGSALIYLVGTALLPLVALPYAKYSDDDKLGLNYQAKAIYFLFALIFISVGTGGIKSNVSPFGAEQVQALGPGAVRTFFNWFYWFINAGSVIAFSIVVYVQVEVNFFVGYLTPFVAMLVATFIFVIPKEKYVLCPPNGSVITDVLRVIHCAIKRKWRMRRQGILKTSSSIGLLDYARTTFGGRFTNGQVDAVVSLCRIVPIFATLILYWTVYRQMQSSFLLQGLNMDLRLGSFEIPAASLSLIDAMIILLLIPFMDRIVYPLLQRCNITLTPLRRIGTGMVFATLSVIAAAVTEAYRRDHVEGKLINDFSGKTYNASSISVFCQVPQYLLIGTSEVFASISALEFAYSQSPRVLQGVVMGLNLATSGIGSFVGGILVQIIHSASKQYSPYGDWYADDINKGRLDLFFYVLAGLMGVNLLAFCMISVRYEYVSPDMLHQSEEEWQAAVRSTTKHWNSDEEEHYTNSPHGIAQED